MDTDSLLRSGWGVCARVYLGPGKPCGGKPCRVWIMPQHYMRVRNTVVSSGSTRKVRCPPLGGFLVYARGLRKIKLRL